MSETVTAAETTAADPLKTAADAMAIAVQAARDGAADAQTTVSQAMPAIHRFFSRFTYTTCYALSYGVVFPTMLLVRSVPKENAMVHGLIDGGLAARDAIASMGNTRDNAPAPESDGATPEQEAPHDAAPTS